MRDGFEVIDADRHVLEPSDLFTNYLPEKFRHRVRIEGPNQSRRSIDGEPISDADQMRPARQREDYGFTFGASKICWASCEAGEELAPVFVEHVGAEHLTIATDYPHSDCIGKFPDRTVGDLTKNNALPMEARGKILSDNPIRLYGLEV